jgi:hypothetical protein
MDVFHHILQSIATITSFNPHPLLLPSRHDMIAHGNRAAEVLHVQTDSNGANIYYAYRIGLAVRALPATD